MGEDHSSGATCCRYQQRHYLGVPYGVYKGGVCVCKYIWIQTQTHLFLKPEPKYLIVAVCEFSALSTHLDNQKSVLTAVN